MGVYLSTLCVSMVMAYFYRVCDASIKRTVEINSPYIRKKKVDRSMCHLFAFFSAAPFLYITCFRYMVGMDYGYYMASSARVEVGAKSYFNEPFYKLLEKISSFLPWGSVSIFIVTGIILISFYWWIIFKQSINPVYSIFLFWGTNIYYISLNGVRQGVAMAFVLVALYYAKEKKLWPYLAFALLGGLTHKGTFVFIPFYWLSRVKLDPKRAWLILFASVGTIIVGGSGLLFIVRQFGYGYYLSGMFQNPEFEWIMVLINLVILLVFCFYAKAAETSKYKEEYQMYFWMQLLATVAALSSAAIPLAKRICWIFSIAQILSLPIFGRLEGSRVGKIVLNVGIIAGFALSIYIGIVINGAHAVLPYMSWLSY